MGFRILKKDSKDYKEKLKMLRNLQIDINTKRWETITQRTHDTKFVDKLKDDSRAANPSDHLTLAKKLKDQIKDEHKDLKIIQGNMEIQPALRLLEEDNN